MKKMRKIFAVLLTLAMVLGMSMTSFAATKDTATITVKNADKATLTYAQVIKADQSTKTGWAFVNTILAPILDARTKLLPTLTEYTRKHQILFIFAVPLCAIS